MKVSVGQTSWSAAGPPDCFFGVAARWILRAKSGSRGTRADQGVCPTLRPQEVQL